MRRRKDDALTLSFGATQRYRERVVFTANARCPMKRSGGRGPFERAISPFRYQWKRTHVSCDTVQSLSCPGCQLVTADEDESHLEGIRLSSQAQIRGITNCLQYWIATKSLS